MKEIIFNICACAMLAGIYKALFPDGKFSSQIKLLVSCFFVISVIGAVRTGLPGAFPAGIAAILDSDISYNDYTVQIERLTAGETADALRKSIRELLAQQGIYPEKIYIDVNISQHGSISITEIKLVFSKTDYELYADRAAQITRQSIGDGTKVTALYASRYSSDAGDGGAENEMGGQP